MKALTRQKVSGKDKVSLMLRMPKSLHRMLVWSAKRSGLSLNEETCWRLSLGLARELVVTVIPGDVKARVVKRRR